MLCLEDDGGIDPIIRTPRILYSNTQMPKNFFISLQISMNATQTHVRIREYVSTVITRTHVSVLVDIQVTTAKQASDGLSYVFLIFYQLKQFQGMVKPR